VGVDDGTGVDGRDGFDYYDDELPSSAHSLVSNY